MRIATTFSSLFIASAIVIAGCNAPPAEDSNAAKAPEVTSATAADSATAAKAKARTVRKSRPVAAPSRDRTATAGARATETVTQPIKINHVQPEYPAIARQARVEGTVSLAVDIGTDGTVTDARVVDSVPLLDQAALDAVRQWAYTPMLKGGVAVPTTIPVTVNFTRS
jgi:TonB family protein